MRRWTEEERKRQSELIRASKPWLRSTGPKTAEGKARASRNAYKHGFRSHSMKLLYAALADCARFRRQAVAQANLQIRLMKEIQKQKISSERTIKPALGVLSINFDERAFACSYAKGNSEKGLRMANSILNSNNAIVELPVTAWREESAQPLQQQAIDALEGGRIVILPQLPFTLQAEEDRFLDPLIVEKDSKTVKYAPHTGKLWGTSLSGEQADRLKTMIARYAHDAQALIQSLLPRYTPYLETGNTSFRPVEVEDRVQSKRHDDRLLHVDAFPSRPLQGKRILRVFNNIHPSGRPRLWQAGEPFEDVAARFVPEISAPLPGSAALMNMVGLTKAKRTAYDHYMMHMHDRMKLNDNYQKTAQRSDLAFLPGTTWLVYTDQVSHAALAGQHVLEQTFTLPVEAMQFPERTPLRVLERIKGRVLA
jgi:hypothetical protein